MGRTEKEEGTFEGRVGFMVTLMDDGQVKLTIENPAMDLWWLLTPEAALRLGRALVEGASHGPNTQIAPIYTKLGGTEH